MPVLFTKLRDSMAKCCAAAIPRSLGDACAALNLPVQKDTEGYKLMLKMCKPRKPTKDNPGEWVQDPASIIRLAQYCVQDVESEHGLSMALPDLSPDELQVWLLDQKINRRGIRIDRQSAAKMVAEIEAHSERLLAEAKRLTGISPRQVAKSVEWLNAQGFQTPDLSKDSVLKLLARPLPPHVRQFLEIRRSLGKSSTAKYTAMIERANSDDRIRGTLVYHGAATGRWCMPGDAELLTPNGWKRFDSWAQGPMMCWDASTGALLMAPGEMFSFQGGGEGVRVDARFLKGLYTPEHRVPYYTSRGIFKVGSAGELAAKGARVSGVPLSGAFTPAGIRPASETRVVVMTQADGYVGTAINQGRFVRFHFVKARKVERCVALLDAAAIPFTRRVYDGVTEVRVRWADAPEYMRQAKQFGPGLLNHDPEVFITELAEWDGHKDPANSLQGFEYSTTSRENAEWVATLAHLANRAATVSVRKRAEEKWAPSYRVYIRSQTSTRIKAKNFQTQRMPARVYCPATPTGFFLVRYEGRIHITGNSGSNGVQPQNLPRGTFSDTELCVDYINENGFDDLLAALWGDPMAAASTCVRSMFMASEGHKLYVSDFSSVEARVLAWLAGEMWKLRAFSEGKDLYKVAAAMTFGVSYDAVVKPQRQVGKSEELGLGYGGGIGAFATMAKVYGIDLETLPGFVMHLADDDMKARAFRMAEQYLKRTPDAEMSLEAAAACDVIKQIWRSKNPQIVAFWRNLECAAKQAVENPGEVFTVGRIKFLWGKDRRFLQCRLPSGRVNRYPFPAITMRKPAGIEDAEPKPTLTYMSNDSVSGQWVRTATYGGKLAENVTQAVARDLMAQAMLRHEAAGYPVVLPVHDEDVADVPDGHGSLADYERIMAEVPEWAEGCPIGAEGFVARRYRK